MKKLTMIIAVMATMMVNVMAQQNVEDLPPAKQRAEQQTEMMTERFSLNETQVEQVAAINLTVAQKMDEVMKLTDRASKFNAYRTTQQEKDEALKRVLTKEQYKQYKKQKDEMREAMKEKHKENK